MRRHDDGEQEQAEQQVPAPEAEAGEAVARQAAHEGLQHRAGQADDHRVAHHVAKIHHLEKVVKIVERIMPGDPDHAGIVQILRATEGRDEHEQEGIHNQKNQAEQHAETEQGEQQAAQPAAKRRFPLSGRPDDLHRLSLHRDHSSFRRNWNSIGSGEAGGSVASTGKDKFPREASTVSRQSLPLYFSM